jgi:ADP-ribosylglycohydrolase/fructose-1,6-bisphosphatase/inositol monophosphatase family enzyme
VNYVQPLAVAQAAAAAAGQRLRDELHRPGGPRGSGGHAPIDAEVEGDIRSALAEAFPLHGIVGEERRAEDRSARDPEGHVWLVDPNDGTVTFTGGGRGSAVAIALIRAGRPVLGVVFVFAAPDDRGEMFAWAEGCGPLTVDGNPAARGLWATELTAAHAVLVPMNAPANSRAWASCVAPSRFRCCPSIAARLALVAAGRAEAALSLHGPVGWDYAAGHALLLGAGGDLVDETGTPVRYGVDGTSAARYVFGGHPAVGRRLAAVDWQPTRQRPVSDPAPPFASLIKGNCASDAGRLARAQGCWLGQLAGDSLGSLVEFQGPEAIRTRYPGGVRELADGGCWNLIAGQPTDDSELALMLARSIVREGRHDPALVAAAYVSWFESHPFDIGSTTRQALAAGADAVAAGTDPDVACRQAANRSSQANGALMRISPLGIHGAALPPGDVDHQARLDAALTHPHPVCQDASALFAVTLAHAIRTGSDPRMVYDFASDWARDQVASAPVRESLAAARDRTPADFTVQQGWVLLALQNAFHQLLHAPSLEEGLVDTVGRGGDTDTNACIAGALLGAVHGRSAIPWRWQERVLSCRPIAGLHGVFRPRPQVFWPTDALVLAERLLTDR